MSLFSSYADVFSPTDLHRLEQAGQALQAALPLRAGASRNAVTAIALAHVDLPLARQQLCDLLFTAALQVDPLLAWAAAWIEQQEPQDAFAAAVYPALAAYEAHGRTTAQHAGLYFTTPGCWSLEHNVYGVMQYRALSYLAWRAAQPGTEMARWQARAAQLAERINLHLWDAALESYVDYDYTQNTSCVLPIHTALLPLYAQIVTPQRAGLLTAHLPAPVSSRLSQTAYLAAKGLHDEGFLELAQAQRAAVLSRCDPAEDPAVFILWMMDWNGTREA